VKRRAKKSQVGFRSEPFQKVQTPSRRMELENPKIEARVRQKLGPFSLNLGFSPEPKVSSSLLPITRILPISATPYDGVFPYIIHQKTYSDFLFIVLFGFSDMQVEVDNVIGRLPSWQIRKDAGRWFLCCSFHGSFAWVDFIHRGSVDPPTSKCERR
jgi:hypothetical protein